MSTFVFFHVGEDVSMPAKMVQSLKAVMPDSRVIMCTEIKSTIPEGVDDVSYSEGNAEELMEWRLRAFARVRLTSPAMYIDTDMLFVLPVDPAAILGDKEIAFCRRDFDRDAAFNGEQRGGMFRRWAGIPLGTLFPYLACATVTKDYHPWHAMSMLMTLMDKERRTWYGDQEALRVYSHMLHPYLVGEFSEAQYACLPDKRREGDVPHILHYKGPARKEWFYAA